MVYNGERAYPGRSKRIQRKTQSRDYRLLRTCAILIVISVMITVMGISYSHLADSNKMLAAGNAYNTQLTESMEFYTAEIERMISPEVISERAKELGLVEQQSAHSIVIPGKG